jgi:hypothetical protein
MRTEKEEKPIARVHDKYLYKSDLNNINTYELSSEDSATMVKQYIDSWIRNQLILYKAEQNLSEPDKNIEEQIENYRTSLLIYKFEQNLLRNKLDTLISDSEIQKYYEINISNFILSEGVIKGIFIKLPDNNTNISEIDRWCQINTEDNLQKLETYCFNHAKSFKYFNDKWTNINSVFNEIPLKYTNPEQLIRFNKRFELRDSSYIYLLYINEFLPEGKVAPLEMVEDNIKSIILNKRKIEFVNELENNIYRDAQNKNNFQIY